MKGKKRNIYFIVTVNVKKKTKKKHKRKKKYLEILISILRGYNTLL